MANHWANEITDGIVRDVSDLLQEIEKSKATINLVHGEASRRVLEMADIIGATTTGLAKSASVLCSVNVKVVSPL